MSPERAGQRVRVIGPGRAGGSVAIALAAVGWDVTAPIGRDAPASDLAGAAHDVDLVVIATPDAAIAGVAGSIEPVPSVVIAHLAGSLGLGVLMAAGHEQVGAVHPLVSMPTPEVGAARLRDGAWFAIAGTPMMRDIVDSWGGRCFEVADVRRSEYHAAACIASNHLVALLGQVERVAAAADVPLEAYLQLVAATVGNVGTLGPAAALTGPAARGDRATIERHRAAIAAMDPEGVELAAYDAMVSLARRLVEGDAEDT